MWREREGEARDGAVGSADVDVIIAVWLGRCISGWSRGSKVHGKRPAGARCVCWGGESDLEARGGEKNRRTGPAWVGLGGEGSESR